MSKNMKRLVASLSAFALLFTASVSATFAQADEITRVNFAAAVASNTNVNTSFTFTIPADGALTTDEQIVVRVPGDLAVNYDAGSIATDVVFTSNGTLGNSTASYDTVAREIRYTLSGADAVGVGETVTVTFASDFVVTPAADTASGEYGFAIRTQDADGAVISTGIAMLRVNNSVGVSVTVQEALILTIDDTSVNLNADPSVNDGKDFSQRTVLTAKTNAVDGYVIRAALSNAGDASASLFNTVANAYIPSGDARTTANHFGYIAYNAEETKSQAQLEADAANAQIFANTDTVMSNFLGANVAHATPTNEQKHTVYYALFVDYLTPAGSYAGTITYTAIPAF